MLAELERAERDVRDEVALVLEVVDLAEREEAAHDLLRLAEVVHHALRHLHRQRLPPLLVCAAASGARHFAPTTHLNPRPSIDPSTLSPLKLAN